MIKRKRLILGFVLVLTILLIGSFGTLSLFKANHQTQNLSSSQSPKITLEIFNGKVFVTAPKINQEIEATNGQSIEVGSSIHTDQSGRAQVIYPGNTVTRIDHSSSIVISQANIAPQEITVDVTAGRVWSRVKKLLGQESYQTETGTVIAAVRGTSYGHEVLAGGRNKIITSKRTVTVHCLNDTQSGLVSQNMKFLLDCLPNSKSEIIPIDTTDQDEWYLFNIEQDRLLDARFGEGTYNDQGEVEGASASASPTSSLKPLPTTKILPQATPIKTTISTQTTTPQPTAQTFMTLPPSPTQTNPPSNPTPTPPSLRNSAPTPIPIRTLNPPPPSQFQPINKLPFNPVFITPPPPPPQIN